MVWAVLLIAQAVTPARPPLPDYARHVTCWCEKCDEQDPAGHWTAARELPAYGTQGVPSTKIFSVATDEQVRVLDGVVVVDRADRIRVLQPTTFLGAPGVLKPGEVYWRVQVWPEGGETVWYHGRMFDTVDDGVVCETPGQRYCTGLIQEKAIRRWWVKVRNAHGQIGWVRADWNFFDESCGVRPR
jgi:hypothetical protein